MLFSNVGIYIEAFTNNLRTKVKKIEKFSLIILQCSDYNVFNLVFYKAYF